MPRRKEGEFLAFVLFSPQYVAGASVTAAEYLLDVLEAVYWSLVWNTSLCYKSKFGKLSGLIPVSVFAFRDRDGDHGAQQAPRVGGQHLHARAEHHRRGEECCHRLGECAVEQVGAALVPVLVLRWGCPQASLAGEGCCSVSGMRRWAQQWGWVSWLGCPLRITQGLFPPPKWQMVSSASQPSCSASCLSILLLLAKRMTETSHRPCPGTAVLIPVLKGVGCLVALYCPFLEDYVVPRKDPLGSSIWISLSHLFSATHMAIHEACPSDSAGMI